MVAFLRPVKGITCDGKMRIYWHLDSKVIILNIKKFLVANKFIYLLR